MNPSQGPSLKLRRTIALSATLVVIAVFWGIAEWEAARLGRPAFFTGFTLLSGLVILMLLGVRRRLPFWPLGSVSTWTQIHLYVGLFTTAIYVVHVPVLIAGGMLESFLSIVFLMVTASGFYGIYASRTLPKRLTAVEGQHRFDRIDWVRHQIAAAAEKACQQISEASAKQVLQTFYQQALSPFFVSRPSVAYVIAPNGNRRRQLLGDLKELDRYLEDEGRRVAGQLAALVRRRDDLDYQFALQLRLRCWVVFHSLLSLVLLAAALVHMLVVLQYIG
ncbi:hypothetical protein [Stieleria mannarensis]|uniref:hypothetical protein n=1 Tax=Stieleria mannarensis TaxID=2755585 RepID=UPI00160369DC|nr:hypothetical protein [Rhodopirellula sp. JC639]